MREIFLTLFIPAFVIGADLENPSPSRLGAESFAQREAAVQELWEQGDDVRELLEEQALQPDPEIAWRARRILRWIDLRITPETPKEVVGLIEGYIQAATAAERERIYGKLIAAKAYQQLFRLPDHLSDQVVSRQLAERVSELAGDVAEELIIEGKDQEALDILTDSRRGDNGQLRWVSLASGMGLREELWDDLEPRDQMRFARWAGDVETVKELVPANHELLTTLQILDGNPAPFLVNQGLLGGPVGTRAELSLALWEGREEEAQAIVADLLSEAKGGGADRSHEAFQILAQTGFGQEALSYFEEFYPAEAFDYYQRTERIDKAFRGLDLKPGERVSKKWLRRASLLVEGEWDINNQGCKELVYLGLFLQERGLADEASRVLRVLLTRLEEEQNENETLGFLLFLAGNGSSLLNVGNPELALQFASELKEDSFQPRRFLMTSFSDDASAARIYDFLEKSEPDLSDWERVRAVFAFFGRTVDFPTPKLAGILKDFEVEAQAGKSDEDWLTLQDSATYRGDTALLERSIRALIAFEGDEQSFTAELAGFHYSNGDFEQGADLWRGLSEKNPADSLQMAFAIVCLTKAGRETEAAALHDQLEKLALGDGRWLVILSELWLRVGDVERAHAYDQRALLLLPSGSTPWFQQLARLAASAQRAGEWRQAAACHRVYEAMRAFQFSPTPSEYLEGPAQADYCLAMDALGRGDEEAMRAKFDRAAAAGGHSGFFADEALPALRAAGRHDEAARLWELLGKTYYRSLALYPNGHNSLNTAAWVAARAGQDIEQAVIWSDAALKLQPRSSAYLDTKAETFFAQGKRKQAVKWSEKACRHSRGVAELGQLRVQFRHFQNDPFHLPEEN